MSAIFEVMDIKLGGMVAGPGLGGGGLACGGGCGGGMRAIMVCPFCVILLPDTSGHEVCGLSVCVFFNKCHGGA